MRKSSSGPAGRFLANRSARSTLFISQQRWRFGTCRPTCRCCRSTIEFAITRPPSGSRWRRRPAGNRDKSFLRPCAGYSPSPTANHRRPHFPPPVRGSFKRETSGPVSTPRACMSHHLTPGARDKTAMTSLRLLAVLDVLSKYTCARQAARASSWRPSHALRLAAW